MPTSRTYKTTNKKGSALVAKIIIVGVFIAAVALIYIAKQSQKPTPKESISEQQPLSCSPRESLQACQARLGEEVEVIYNPATNSVHVDVIEFIISPKTPPTAAKPSTTAQVNNSPLSPSNTADIKPVNTIYPLTTNTDEIKIVNLTNAERKANGLNELNLNGQLCTAAQLKADDMRVNNYFAHTSPIDSEKTASYFVREVNYKYRFVGENLARGFSNINAAFIGWLNSPTHKRNILNPIFDDICVGINGDLIVQTFAERL